MHEINSSSFYSHRVILAEVHFKNPPLARSLSAATGTLNDELLASGQYSDLTIKCQDRQFSVHRAILSAHSPFFEKAFSGGFRAGLPHRQDSQPTKRCVQQESHEKIISLNDYDPTVIALVISWLYTGIYSSNIVHDKDFEEAFELCSNNAPIVSAKVYLAADQYLMKSLKEESYEAIRTDLLLGSLNEQARIETLRFAYEETQSQEFRDLVAFATLKAVHSRKPDEKKLEVLVRTIPELGCGLV